MVMQLVELLPLCGISFFELLTSNQIEKFVDSTTDGMRSVPTKEFCSLTVPAIHVCIYFLHMNISSVVFQMMMLRKPLLSQKPEEEVL
jgi:hypothetical protein